MTFKKNWTMRAAVLMLALVLITSCFVGGTFAKYVKSGTGSDTARVAKFGVEVTASTDMFSKTYVTHDNSFTLNANTVVSSNEDKLVAPGTSQSMAAVELSGTPEVAVRVSYKLTNFELTNWTVGPDEYCPLVFTVNGTAYKIDGTAITDVAGLVTAVKDAVAGYSKDYKANTDLSTVGADSLAIGWEWPFEGNDDAKDTALGDRAAAGIDGAGKIAIELTATVTQID